MRPFSSIFCASTGPTCSPATPTLSLPLTTSPRKSRTAIPISNNASPPLLQPTPSRKPASPCQRKIRLFGSLFAAGRLGAGECSAIALAVHRRYILAIDDRLATTQARRADATLRILATQDLVVSMIRQGLLDIAEADRFKQEWATRHRFRLKLTSFRDLLE